MFRSIDAFLILSVVCLLIIGRPAVYGQEELELPVEEAPVEVSEDAIRDALLSLLEGDQNEDDDAVTVDDPDIPVAALDILLEPLTLDALKPEIEAWNQLLIESIERLSEKELQLYHLNAAMAKEGSDAPSKSSSDPSPEKVNLIDEITRLRAVRTSRADHLRHVLKSFEAKGGDPEEIKDIRAYLSTVGGVRLNTESALSTRLTLQEWAQAHDGGQRLLRKVAEVITRSIVGLLIGWLIGFILSFMMKRFTSSSRLLRRFVMTWGKRIGLLIGFLTGLSMIGTNMTPVLASLGALGFILAFALQNTISNFASGMLILFQKPFDVGNKIETAGVIGEVEAVSLFSTHLSTAENKKVIIPNNMIWDDVLVNATSAPTRRLSIEVEICLDDHKLEEAELVLLSIMKAHPDILDDPEATLTLTSVTTESITFTCWPWVLTKDKDRIRWELVTEFGKNLSVIKSATKSESA